MNDFLTLHDENSFEANLFRGMLLRKLLQRLIHAGMPAADAQAAVSSGNWQGILTWVIQNAPAILSMVEAILKLLGVNIPTPAPGPQG